MASSIDWDEGVARERTILAWERTAIASIAVAVLVVRAGIVERRLWLALPVAALLVLVAGLEWWHCWRIPSEHRHIQTDGAVTHAPAVAAAGGVTIVAAVGSIVLALAG